MIEVTTTTVPDWVIVNWVALVIIPGGLSDIQSCNQKVSVQVQKSGQLGAPDLKKKKERSTYVVCEGGGVVAIRTEEVGVVVGVREEGEFWDVVGMTGMVLEVVEEEGTPPEVESTLLVLSTGPVG